MFNVLLAGQKWFGAEVFRALQKIDGVTIAAVCSPVGGKKTDRLTAIAENNHVFIIPSGTLKEATMPNNIDLIIAAHSHDFISEKTRLRARYGGIGYHPSLLPIHRGRDAIRWSIRMRERVTGGTVYRLSNKVDGGDILAQRHVFIYPDDNETSLWERDLCPLGVDLICGVVKDVLNNGYVMGMSQDDTLATFEPTINSPPLFRPDLLMLEYPLKPF